jgi:hypothetical protein
LAVIAAFPLAGPVVVGEKTTLIVQVVPAARVAPQLPPPVVGLENGPVNATAMPVAPAPPVLCSVSAWVALVVPCTVLENVSEVGVTFRTAMLGTWNSTAPASTELLVFLGLPKKSVEGAAAYVDAADGT